MGNFLKMIFIFSFFLGCSGHIENNFGIFSQDKRYQSAIRYTRKADITNSLETKALIRATYLNPIYSEFNSKDREYFYIGVYINDSENLGLENPLYSLSLNSKEPLKLTKVKKDSRYSKELPFFDKWFNYYIVEFDRVNLDTLTLKYSYEDELNCYIDIDKYQE